MSALERNPQLPAPTPHKVLGPGINGRVITRGPLATRMVTGLSCGRQSGSLNPRRNSRAPAETREYPGASPFQGNLFSLHCLDFQAEDRLTTVARGKTVWESLVGKPRGKASRESHRSLDPCEGTRDTAATAREEKRTCMPPLETKTDSPG